MILRYATVNKKTALPLASVRLRSTNEGMPQLSLLRRRHRTVCHSLRCSQINTGQFQFVQSRHDFGSQEFDANLIHHLLQRIIPLFDTLHGKASIPKQGCVPIHRLSIADARNPCEQAVQLGGECSLSGEIADAHVPSPAKHPKEFPRPCHLCSICTKYTLTNNSLTPLPPP